MLFVLLLFLKLTIKYLIFTIFKLYISLRNVQRRTINVVLRKIEYALTKCCCRVGLWNVLERSERYIYGVRLVGKGLWYGCTLTGHVYPSLMEGGVLAHVHPSLMEGGARGTCLPILDGGRGPVTCLPVLEGGIDLDTCLPILGGDRDTGTCLPILDGRRVLSHVYPSLI